MAFNTESNYNDEWVMVEKDFVTEVYTKSRHPQYNHDNVSSVQAANASSDSNAKVDDGDPSSICAPATSETPDTLESKTSSSSDAGTSLNTVAPPVDIVDRVREAVMTSVYPPSLPALTSSVLGGHHQEAERCHYCQITEWVRGTGAGDRLAVRMASSAHLSTVAVRATRSMASSISHDGPYIPLSPANLDETIAVGAWSDAYTYEQSLHASLALGLEDE